MLAGDYRPSSTRVNRRCVNLGTNPDATPSPSLVHFFSDFPRKPLSESIEFRAQTRLKRTNSKLTTSLNSLIPGLFHVEQSQSRPKSFATRP
jgi:hypothetical protein